MLVAIATTKFRFVETEEAHAASGEEDGQKMSEQMPVRPVRGPAQFARRWMLGFGYTANIAYNIIKRRSFSQLRLLRATRIIRRSRSFDEDWYLSAYPDVAEWTGDPIWHYVLFGAREGRDPSAHFSTIAYLKDNPEMAESGANPFAHFLVRRGGQSAQSSPVKDNLSELRSLNLFSSIGYLPAANRFCGGIGPLASTVWRVFRREGLKGIRYRVKLLAYKTSVSAPARVSHNTPQQVSFESRVESGLNATTRSLEVRHHTESVDIVVCVHNAFDDVRRCLESITSKTTPPYNLVIVDDGSDEPTASFLRNFMIGQPGQLIRNDIALGYTRAANVGLQASSGRFVVLLNSDTIVPWLWLDRLIECIGSDDRIGIVGPLSNTASWQSIPQIQHDGDWALNSLPDGIGVDEMAQQVAECSVRAYPEVGFLNGFCLLIDRRLIDDIGYFDEATFGDGYGEENDYCLRATAAGWRLVVAEDTYVYHAQSKSYSDERRRKLVARSDQMLWEKHGERIIPSLDATRNNHSLLAMRRKASIAPERRSVRTLMREKFEGVRILFLLPVRDSGGGANVVITEARTMMKSGVDVVIANLRMHQEAFETSYPDIEIPVIYLNDPSELENISEGYDALIATVFFTVEWLRGIASTPNRVLGYYIQDFEPFFFDEADPLHKQALLSYTMRSDLKMFTKTHWNSRELEKNVGVVPTVVGSSYDWDRFFPISRKADGVVTIAAMIRPSTPRRGPEITAAVLKRLCGSHTTGIHIYIFGCSPADPFVKPFSSEAKVSLMGHLTPNAMSQLLAKVDIFTDFSKYQAMGLTALEAMASGVAVVGPILGGLCEIITDRENGLLVDTSNEDDCYKAVEELIENNELRSYIQKNSLRSCWDYFPEKPSMAILDTLFS